MKQKSLLINSTKYINPLLFIGILFFVVNPIFMRLGIHNKYIDIASPYGLMRAWAGIVVIDFIIATFYFCVFISEAISPIKKFTLFISLIPSYFLAHGLNYGITEKIILEKTNLAPSNFIDILNSNSITNLIIILLLLFFILIYTIASILIFSSMNFKINNKLKIKKRASKIYIRLLAFINMGMTKPLKSYQFSKVVLSTIFMASLSIYVIINIEKISSIIVIHELNHSFFPNNTLICNNIPTDIQVYFTNNASQKNNIPVIIRYKNNDKNYLYKHAICEQN